jgi:UDP-4-amino-4,6-dideoxy-N-acetyl-beta-L-altrosamine N-acetyltransferase
MHYLGNLRQIKEDELRLMLSWRNSPSVRANMYTQHEISEEEHLAWWKKASHRNDQKYFIYENRIPLGIVAITEIDDLNCNCSWAFYSSPEAPKGTGSLMEFLAIEYVFNNLNLKKLACEVLAFNTPVIKLHQKFGFVVEGIMRKQKRYGNGFCDVYKLGLLRDEWQDKKSEILNKITRNRS